MNSSNTPNTNYLLSQENQMKKSLGLAQRPAVYLLSAAVVCVAVGFYFTRDSSVVSADDEVTSPTVTVSVDSGKTAEGKKIPTVTVATVMEKQISESVPVLGSLQAREIIFVNPEISGYQIESVSVDVGDVVKKGDVLASLNTDVLVNQQSQVTASKGQIQAQVAQAKTRVSAAKAAVDQAQSDYARYATLRKKGHVTQAMLDQKSALLKTTKADLNSARAGVKSAEAQVQEVNTRVSKASLDMNRSHIIAAADGVIASRNAFVGNIASVGAEPMFRIIKDNEIEAVVEITESALAKINIGDSAGLEISGVGDIDGTLRLIEPQINTQTRLASLRISLSTDDSKVLREGLSVSGNIVYNSRQGVAVDTRSVLSEVSGGNYVLVVNGDKVEKRVIEIGVVTDGLREVESGLAAGEVIVQKAGAFLQDGDQIKVLTQQDKAALLTGAPTKTENTVQWRSDRLTTDAKDAKSQDLSGDKAEATL